MFAHFSSLNSETFDCVANRRCTVSVRRGPQQSQQSWLRQRTWMCGCFVRLLCKWRRSCVTTSYQTLLNLGFLDVSCRFSVKSSDRLINASISRETGNEHNYWLHLSSVQGQSAVSYAEALEKTSFWKVSKTSCIATSTSLCNPAWALGRFPGFWCFGQ